MTVPERPSLIETMLLRDGAVALWPGHRARLLRSAQALGYPLDGARLDAWWANERARLAGAGEPRPRRVRLLLDADGGLQVSVSVQALAEAPVRLGLASSGQPGLAPCPPLDAHDPWLQHKSTHRPAYRPVQAWLRDHPGCFDLIFCNTDGEVCEGSRSNVYFQTALGEWITPPCASGVLPGVQRAALIAAGRVREARVRQRDLPAMHGLRVSNAVHGWLDARWLPGVLPEADAAEALDG